jgi:hypothetical protein
VGELMAVDYLRLTEMGGSGPAAERGELSIGGRVPVNPSGGLECKDHPIGATGLGQITELITQLRGEAGVRQVEGAKVALQENGGGSIGYEEGVVAVNIFREMKEEAGMEIPHDVPLPVTGLAGFDADLSKEELGAQDAAHRFAREVMRPIGRELDKLTAEDVCAQGSPFWDFQSQIAKMGFGPEGLAGLPPAVAARFEGLVVQELAWGDAGLATSAGAGGVPHLLAATSGNRELIDLYANRCLLLLTKSSLPSSGLTISSTMPELPFSQASKMLRFKKLRRSSTSTCGACFMAQTTKLAER